MHSGSRVNLYLHGEEQLGRCNDCREISNTKVTRGCRGITRTVTPHSWAWSLSAGGGQGARDMGITLSAVTAFQAAPWQNSYLLGIGGWAALNRAGTQKPLLLLGLTEAKGTKRFASEESCKAAAGFSSQGRLENKTSAAELHGRSGRDDFRGDKFLEGKACRILTTPPAGWPFPPASLQSAHAPQPCRVQRIC